MLLLFTRQKGSDCTWLRKRHDFFYYDNDDDDAQDDEDNDDDEIMTNDDSDDRIIRKATRLPCCKAEQKIKHNNWPLMSVTQMLFNKCTTHKSTLSYPTDIESPLYRISQKKLINFPFSGHLYRDWYMLQQSVNHVIRWWFYGTSSGRCILSSEWQITWDQTRGDG